MFSKVIPRIKQFYFLPVAFMIPTRAFTDGYEEYNKYKIQDDVSLAHHTFCCFMGAWTGAAAGAFLGATWPISIPIFIGRSMNKK